MQIVQTIDKSHINRADAKRERVIILLFASSLFTASIITVTIAGFQLSVFRATLMLSSLFFILPKIAKIGNNKYSALHFVWLFYGLISVAWCNNLSLWAHELYFLFSAFACVFLMTNYLVTFNMFLKACKVYGILILVHNTIGYYEMVTRDYHWIRLSTSAVYSNFIRVPLAPPISVFGNPNDYATVLLFGIAILTICVYYSKTLVGRFVYLGGLISSVYQIIRTQSRANIIALFVGVLIYICLTRKLSGRRLIIAVSLAYLLGFSLLFLPITSMLSDFVRSYLHFGLSGGSESMRLNLLSAGWESFLKTYGLGTGAGNLAYNIGLNLNLVAGDLHIWWLEVLFSYGVIIFVLYINRYYSLTKTCIKNALAGSYISKVFAAFLVAFLIGAFSSSSCMRNETLWCAWAFIIAFELNIESQEMKKYGQGVV